MKRFKWLSELRTGLVLVVVALAFYLAADFLMDLPPVALEFHSEVVRAVPMGDCARFIGDYNFIAHHSRRRSYPIGYPTQNGNMLPAPADVVVIVDGRAVPFTATPQGLHFEMPVRPGQPSILHIEYTMPAPDHRATYITRTANLWPRPVTEARFVLPPGATSNYHQAKSTETVFRKFRPVEDWNIQW